MSLFKFGNFEKDIDFADVDFLERLEKAKRLMTEDAKQVPKTGKTANIVRAQCKCYFNFFDRVFGEKTHETMFDGRTSLNLCLDAIDALLSFENSEAAKLNERYSDYTVRHHGNRQQKRAHNKQNGTKKVRDFR